MTTQWEFLNSHIIDEWILKYCITHNIEDLYQDFSSSSIWDIFSFFVRIVLVRWVDRWLRVSILFSPVGMPAFLDIIIIKVYKSLAIRCWYEWKVFFQSKITCQFKHFILLATLGRGESILAHSLLDNLYQLFLNCGAVLLSYIDFLLCLHDNYD